ncbi:MAG: helix-turn-helix transcriptional regulator [Clostridia bacterium]|nr:helix-turn-helix transcriptional regulator [Clostridia bacterium]
MKLEIKKLSFPEQMKFVRMFLQLSQTELAEKIGISYSTVSRWERENRTPQLAMLGKFYSFCMRNGIELDLSDKEG